MRRAVCFVLCLTACAPPPLPPDVDGRPAAIVGGSAEPGEDAVVLVTVLGAVGLCTGTLIAPNVVLTAKHCVQAANATAPYPPNVLTVSVGPRVGATTDYRVRYVDTTPGAFTQSPTTGLGGEIFGVDVGVVITRNDVEGVTPIPVRRDRPDDMVGQEFTAIGYGQRPDANAGIKYRTTGILNSVQTNGVLLTEMTICSGDSGGPMIQETPTRQVIGVASFGERGACPSRQDGYNALYNNLDLIDRALVIGGHCPTPSDEVCNGIDDNCDGAVDEGCAALGDACAEDSDCAYAQRPSFLDPVDAPVVCRESVCALPCDPLEPVASCAAIEAVAGPVPVDGLLCERIDGCEAYCRPGQPGAAPDGAGCAADTDCLSGACTDPGDGDRRCVTGCVPGAGTCPVGDACVGFGETCGACVEASIVSGARELGEPCEADADCADPAGCLDGACTSACDPMTLCAAGYRCDLERRSCVRGERGAVGDPCGDVDDCATGLHCASDGFCTQMCASAEECPADHECASVDGATRCRPTQPGLGESCSGACRTGVCEDGTCARACGPRDSCTAGYACQRDSAGNPRCLPTGGCAVGSVGAATPGRWGLGWLAALALALGVARRRRRVRG